MMTKKERVFMVITLFFISLLTSYDLVTDLAEGVTWWHVSIEGMIAVLALVGIFILLKGSFKLRHRLDDIKILSEKLQAENAEWKRQSKKYLDGLSKTIDEQLSSWELSKAEKEVAFLLLKGFSSKEIAEIRGTAEKTARTQAATIYSKAGLANRAQLAAYFLEDLLLPQ